jgi:hypothetical protein
MRLTNSNILQYLESSSSTLVDGIFLKKGPSVNDADSYSFGLGFHPSNLSQALFDSSANITAFKYRGVQVEITRPSDELGTVITPTSIANNTNGDFTISSQGTSKIQLTDTRLLERLDFGFDENLTALNSLSPFNITNPGPLLTLIPLTSNYRLTSNKNVIRLGKRQQDLGNVTSNSINIASITNADVGTVIYVVAGESNPTYNIICRYLTPPSASSFQNINDIPIVDRSYSNKTVTLVQNTIIKFTLVQRWFYFGPLFGSISWKYWYMENLDGESFALSNRATALETRATNLETRATNLETRSTNLESSRALRDGGTNIINADEWIRNLRSEKVVAYGLTVIPAAFQTFRFPVTPTNPIGTVNTTVLNIDYGIASITHYGAGQQAPRWNPIGGAPTTQVPSSSIWVKFTLNSNLTFPGGSHRASVYVTTDNPFMDIQINTTSPGSNSPDFWVFFKLRNPGIVTQTNPPNPITGNTTSPVNNINLFYNFRVVLSYHTP